MQIYPYQESRELPKHYIYTDFVIAGGGLAGICSAIAAARNGLKVALIQDRPVLGGNASSEVRLWALGATSHLGNNNRWAREGGIMGEILETNLEQLESNDKYLPLDQRFAIMLPLKKGEKIPAITLNINSIQSSSLIVKLLIANEAYNHTPEVVVDTLTLDCIAGTSDIIVDSHYITDTDRYLFFCLEPNSLISIALTDENPPAIKTVWNQVNEKVAKNNRQTVEGDYGVDEFDFWLPLRRPAHILPAMTFSPALNAYSAESVIDGYSRPNDHTHAWVADKTDKQPEIMIEFDHPVCLSNVGLMFDNDFDHAMETVQYGHVERVSLQCIRSYRLYADDILVAKIDNNFLSWNQYRFDTPIIVSKIKLIIDQTYGGAAVVYSIHCNI